MVEAGGRCEESVWHTSGEEEVEAVGKNPNPKRYDGLPGAGREKTGLDSLNSARTTQDSMSSIKTPTSSLSGSSIAHCLCFIRSSLFPLQQSSCS
jgi:hypothetical protein